jgi:hypothetical protein
MVREHFRVECGAHRDCHRRDAHERVAKLKGPIGIAFSPRVWRSSASSDLATLYKDDSSAPVQLSNAFPFRSSSLKKVKYVIT